MIASGIITEIDDLVPLENPDQAEALVDVKTHMVSEYLIIYDQWCLL